MPYIETQSGTNWHYNVKGQGEVLLFLHGWSFDSDIWAIQIDFFSKYFRTVVIDFPGHGQTDYQGEVDIVDDLAEILKYLKFDKINPALSKNDLKGKRKGGVNLLGHSLGAIFSLKFVLKYPEYINKLILAGFNPKYVNSKDYNFGLKQQQIEKLRTMLASDYPQVLLIFRRWLFTEQERGQNNFKSIWEMLSEKKHWPKRQALFWLLSIIEQEDFRNRLSEIKIPTLILSGTDDLLCPKEAAQSLSEGIKNSRLEFFQNCGHLPFLTQAGKFNTLIKEFLKF